MAEGTIFLELNPFRSRLQVLSALVSAPERSVTICPSRAEGVDWREFQGTCDSLIIATMATINQVGNVRFRIIVEAMRALVTLRSDEVRYSSVVFTAADDYMWALPLLRTAVTVRRITTGVVPNLVVLRYRVDDLLPNPSIRHRLRGLYLRFSLGRRCKYVVFDERIDRPNHYFIPDPWTGPFSPAPSQRKNVSKPSAAPVALLIGTQNARKGFDVAVDAIERLAVTNTSFQVKLIGNVEAEAAPSLLRLQDCLGERFIHIDSYVPDRTLADALRHARVVLLPYSTRFTSTSGVLSRVAASGRPVVSSDHGLVGWRVRKYRLGVTFAYPNSDQLANALETFLANGVGEGVDPTYSNTFSEGEAMTFASRMTAAACARAFAHVLA